jgi:aspartyl-tRNA(Asn)/glutamyl-tRNA(Gln) amidotransferase subunit A
MRPAGIIFDAALLEEPGTDDAVRVNTLAFADRLRAAGIPVEIRTFEAFAATRRSIKELGWLLGYEAYALHKDTIAAHGDRMDPRVVARLRNASLYPEENFARLRELRPSLIADAGRELGEFLFFSPTVKHVAPVLQPLVDDISLFQVANLGSLALTTPGNFLNMPGVSLPSGTDAEGHPTGILLSASSGRDDALLSAALWVEQHV